MIDSPDSTSARAISRASSGLPPDACSSLTSVGRGKVLPQPRREQVMERAEAEVPELQDPGPWFRECAQQRVIERDRITGADGQGEPDVVVCRPTESEFEHSGARGVDPLRVVDRHQHRSRASRPGE